MFWAVVGLILFAALAVFCALRFNAGREGVWLLLAVVAALAAAVCLFMVMATLLMLGGVN